LFAERHVSLRLFEAEGKAVAYPIRENEVDNIWVQPLDGSRGRQITNFDSEQILNFRWSPDGKSLCMGVTLVVLIDDLDRCLPETTISTLEAIRLFLFLKNTAFVIAADDAMIKHAVRRHFEGVDDELVTNYFDKLIQLPIRVPPLGTQEVRAYMMLLFVENSRLAPEVKEKIRVSVCTQLGQTWQGKRVDRAFVQSLHDKFADELIGQFDTADRLAPLWSAKTPSGDFQLNVTLHSGRLAVEITIRQRQAA